MGGEHLAADLGLERVLKVVNERDDNLFPMARHPANSHVDRVGAGAGHHAHDDAFRLLAPRDQFEKGMRHVGMLESYLSRGAAHETIHRSDARSGIKASSTLRSGVCAVGGQKGLLPAVMIVNVSLYDQYAQPIPLSSNTDRMSKENADDQPVSHSPGSTRTRCTTVWPCRRDSPPRNRLVDSRR